MASDNQFQETINSLFQGMDSFIASKTVIGEAITLGDTIILPLIEVSFGVAASAKLEDKKSGGGGGLGGKMTPSAVLVIREGSTRLVSVKQQDGVSKVLDMIPELVDKLTGKKAKGPSDEEIVKAVQKEVSKDKGTD